MLSFLNMEQEMELYKFVRNDLSVEMGMHIDVEEDKIVTGMTGNDKIEEAFIVRFFPEDANVEWVEDKIASKVHKFLYDNDIKNVQRSIVLMRDVWLGRVRYGIVYTAGDL